MTVVESGMTFGPFDIDECFPIENSPLVSTLGKGIKVAEFLLFRNSSPVPSIWIVEAKSSSPRAGSQPNFEVFLGEIRDKLLNSLWIYVSARTGRHQTHGLPSKLDKVSLAKVKFRLVLVIRGHHDEWLIPLQEALRKLLASDLKIWALDPHSLIVLNDTLARSQKLVS